VQFHRLAVVYSSYKAFIDVLCKNRECICSQRSPEKMGKEQAVPGSISNSCMWYFSNLVCSRAYRATEDDEQQLNIMCKKPFLLEEVSLLVS